MDIHITDLAKTQCLDRFGISEELVREIVLQRDSMEVIVFDESSKIAVYTKKIYTILAHKRSSLMIFVLGHVVEGVLQVSFVFKIPPMIYAQEDLSPLGVLKRLVDRFGVELTIGTQKAKFILKETIPIDGDHPQIVSVQKPVDNFMTCFYIKMNKDANEAQCALCFALDVESYMASL